MSASLLPRAPGQIGALGLGLGVGCDLAAQVKGGSLPQTPDGAWKGLHLSCCMSVVQRGSKVHVLRQRQAQEVRECAENLQEQMGVQELYWKPSTGDVYKQDQASIFKRQILGAFSMCAGQKQ